ncbi:putative TPX2 family protein [Hibiscus syriacus]|uniref:TPX2 family protein n=1 Tax=Hibiscus syriacus TaxID=106335 RepID=A0A6A3A4M1_HIBSY|nr:leucine-rich repeat extensin-like protein 5 [Hibiscus syriacus]KAE8698993.1 putative TPX2 family protein [Hibiscus syriacus]
MANTSLFFSIILTFFIQTKQDNPCPYPCYPPPTGPGGSTGMVTQSPPITNPQPSQTGALYPPPGTSNPTPTGNLPYFPPPPPYGNSLYGQPPPDPILPYFPYYYRKPPHQRDDQSPATKTGVGKPYMTMMIATAFLLVLFYFS